jgi:hypothetical protein
VDNNARLIHRRSAQKPSPIAGAPCRRAKPFIFVMIFVLRRTRYGQAGGLAQAATARS